MSEQPLVPAYPGATEWDRGAVVTFEARGVLRMFGDQAVALSVCSRCAVPVLGADRPTHAQWHYDQDRAFEMIRRSLLGMMA